MPTFPSGSAFGSRSNASRGPSSHSSSSRSSAPRPQPRPVQQPVRPPQPRRPRINQPLGYLIANALAPRYYYGRNHDYVYYPESWTDSSTGTHYESGYYDENGTRYDNVAVEKNGRYENVICHCDYCDQDIVLNLDANTEALTELKCPNCTAPLTIKSALDDELKEETQGSTGSSYGTGSSYSDYEPKTTRKKRKKWPWVVAILAVLGMFGNALDAAPSNPAPVSQPVQQIQQIYSVPEQTEDTIYLKSAGSGVYTYAASASSADKTLVWDSDADSYYDADTDCWLWYNTDVDPALWQYWYEDISSNYESGWMEHDSDGWYIETTEGTWIDLPSGYRTSRLWYIAE